MDTEVAYQEALDYLFSFVDFSRTHQQNLAPEHFDLKRMEALMLSLDQPHRTYSSVHVAGSKGKGSVCAFCASVLQAAGYKVGLYTSPHLKDFEERIQINGKPIPRRDLVALVNEIKPFVAQIEKITTFEIATALAFLYFARQAVDMAVVEVGLGGRLDATNIITPIVSVITHLYLEHTSILGNTLSQIAREKAGIVKDNTPVVLAPQAEEARGVIMAIASNRHARVIDVAQTYGYKLVSHSLEGQTFSVWGERNKKGERQAEIRIRLLGEHQVENAVTAYATLQLLCGLGFPFDEDALRKGFASAEWPARFEVISQKPLIVIDSAHIPEAAQMMRNALEEYFPGRQIILVIGVSEDKDVRGILRELKPLVKEVVATQSDHPRALDVEKLAEISRESGFITHVTPTVSEALDEALRLKQGEAFVFVTGSIFVAASARIAWLESRRFEVVKVI
ncbi:MAG: folylpolyglutamate synthase/dihydrofolate synthase family protein [Chloroflexota bacterium]